MVKGAVMQLKGETSPLDGDDLATEAAGFQHLDASKGRTRYAGPLGAFVPWAMVVLLALMFITFCFLLPDTFASVANVRVMVEGQATVLLLAMALLIPLRAGDFDLSVSAVMVLTGAAVGILTLNNESAWMVYLLPLLIGPVVGVVNGLLVVKVGIDSFIATLGTLTILGGLSIFLSGGTLVTTIPPELSDFASHRFLGLTTFVWIGWIVAGIIWYVFELTPVGRFLLFVGGNRASAELAGLRVTSLRVGSFIVSGALASLAGMLFAGSLGAVDTSSNSAYLLPPITAAFLGTSAIKVGRFNVAGTLVALYLLTVGITGLVLLGFDSWVSDVFNGACLILAVAFTIVVRRGSK
ncbi:sugar ABC transporter permease [Nocardioides sp. LS1]|nr:sugar ABC transporter permease [Nocardioides sp. LS1]